MRGKYPALLGCLFLMTMTGPCCYYYYYYEGHPQAKRAVANVMPNCRMPDRLHSALEESGSWAWHRVDEHFTWYINSAHLDQRPKETPFIRIVAMSREPKKHILFCQMWSGNKTLGVVKAHQQELWIRAWDSSEAGLYYHPYLLSCPMLSHSETATAVSISIDNPCRASTHRLQVPRRREKKPKGFVVCLKPLNFTSDISLRLIEWLELQYLLGADDIFVYVREVHPETRRVLEYYEKKGRLKLVNHTLPGGVVGLWQKRRHEMAVYNDCLYRHLETHHFVVNLDLDEAIVPVVQDSWPELLLNHSTSASISVRCVYFFDELGEEPSIPQHLHMLRHVYRSSQFAPPGFAQKSFFSTRNAEVVSNHYALRAIHPNTLLLSGLDTGQARLHHYRKECPPMMQQDCDRKYMKFWQRDTLLWKYRRRLEEKVRKRMQDLYV